MIDPSDGSSTSAGNPERPLASYAHNPPEGLSPAREDGLRVKGTEHYVDLADGQVVRVVFDQALGAYCAWDTQGAKPSSLALHRPDGSTSWRENPFAMKLLPYQVSMEHRASFDRRSEALLGQDPQERGATLKPLYQSQQAKLKADADSFFKTVTPASRLPAPQLVGTETFARFVQTMLEPAQGMVLTEQYFGIGSKMQLIDNMSTLAGNGVTTLYLDRLRTDIDQSALDAFARSGVMDRRLKNRLHHVDVNSDASGHMPYTYQNLISAARENGIRVRALDCAARYQAELSIEDLRRGLFTYHAHHVINADRLSHPQGKWVALVTAPDYQGKTAAARQKRLLELQQRGVTSPPSLAQLQGVMNVHVEDLPSGPAMRVAQEPALSPVDVRLEAGGQGLMPYELSSRYRPHFESDIRKFPLSDDPNSDHRFITVIRDYNRKMAQLEQLYRASDAREDSRHFFFEKKPVDLPRPPTPTLQRYSSASAILGGVYRDASGLVMGTAYNATGARKFLIEHMQDLEAQQVKTLYMENLITEYDQPLLDAFASDGVMPASLRDNLRRQDQLQQMDPLGPYSLVNLVNAAQANGIGVKALDTSVSFNRDLRLHDANRASLFKYMAHTVIQADQGKRGPHKWVALVESSQANTVQDIPGLAELQGVIGVRVIDVGGQPMRVVPDQGEVIKSLLPIAVPSGSRHVTHFGHHYVKSDLLLEVKVSEQAVPRAPISPGKLLNRPDEFLIERKGDGFELYLATNVPGQFIAYDVSMANDRFWVHITELSPHGFELAQVSNVRFRSLDELVWALKANNRKQINGTTVIPVSPPRLRDMHPQLTRPGMYLVERRPEGVAIYHRSKDSSVKRTLVGTEKASGKVFINRPEWNLTDAHLFNDLDALTTHLENALGLRRPPSS
ncbi:membrane-targeted effector domain-containing toxin [Pseudomonas alvandae]|uniref:membrane-targeted effector domain-containing toxin n=1 Tax=Pseudomonas TaxID=286 RepID=UPI00389A8EF7